MSVTCRVGKGAGQGATFTTRTAQRRAHRILADVGTALHRAGRELEIWVRAFAHPTVLDELNNTRKESKCP